MPQAHIARLGSWSGNYGLREQAGNDCDEPFMGGNSHGAIVACEAGADKANVSLQNAGFCNYLLLVRLLTQKDLARSID
jgi:hypothetical protein